MIESLRLGEEVSSSPGVERWVERSLSATTPPMRGAPDLIEFGKEGASVLEYKSGNVDAVDAEPAGRYGLQVLLYAAMLRARYPRCFGKYVLSDARDLRYQ